MNLRLVFAAISLVFSAMLLGTGVYQNVVDAVVLVMVSTIRIARDTAPGEHRRLAAPSLLVEPETAA